MTDREEAGTQTALEVAEAEAEAPTSEETTATDLLETPEGTTTEGAEEMIEETTTEETTETIEMTIAETMAETIEETTVGTIEMMIEETTEEAEETIEETMTTPKTGIEELRAEEARILMNLSMMNFACSDLKLRIDIKTIKDTYSHFFTFHFI